MISFRIDWLDLLGVQWTLKSVLQHHGLKASILQHSAFLMLQLSHPYMTTGKTITLTIWIFAGKVMSVLFNVLSRFHSFPSKEKVSFKSWLQSSSAVILEPKKITSVLFLLFPPSICHDVMGPDAMILVLIMLSFKPTFSLSSFTLSKRFFSSSSLPAIRMVVSANLRLLVFLLAILIPTCDSSSLAFHMLYSA